MDTLKYSELLADWLRELGYTHCFMVAGGGCMHLIDGFRSRFECVPVVHEVAAGIAAEHFNECTAGGRAFALVTTGPGLTNIVTAIAGAYAERRELLVIAGQVKSTDLLQHPLRQRGIQEADGTAVAKPITVESRCLTKPIGKAEFIASALLARRPHPGPVLIEVCLDVQGAKVSRSAMEAIAGPSPRVASVDPVPTVVSTLVAAMREAERPVLLLGGLVPRATAWDRIAQIERLGIPVMTTTSAIDRVPSDSPINVGRPGTWGGQRSANVLIAQADVVVAIGAQLDLQQTGFNWSQFIPSGRLYQVYPCRHELEKGHPTITAGFDADPDAVLRGFLDAVTWRDSGGWLAYARKARELLPLIEPENAVRPGYVSSFELMHNLSRASSADDVLALSSSGGSFTGALQVYDVKPRQYATTSAAFASMGYGLATAIGAALARPGRRVVLVEGDGGFAQNLQELAVVRRHQLPIKIFILDNAGYGSIRATQKKFFGGANVGCDEATGLGFPDWVQLFSAFGIPARYLEPDEVSEARLRVLLESKGAAAWIVRVDPEQPNWPAVTSRILPDGRMESNPLYRQVPPITPEILAQVGRYLPADETATH